MAIQAGETIEAADFINESERNATPANDAGKGIKLESDGYVDPDFIKKISPVIRVYTSNDTWSKPTGLKYVRVRLVGGGGGSGSAANGGDGGTSSFGSHLSATGGEDYGGSGGVASNGNININGSAALRAVTYTGTQTVSTAHGGVLSILGLYGKSGAIPNSQAGDFYSGGAGAYSEKIIGSADLGSTETVTVGAAGSACSNGNPGNAGVVIVEEFYA